MSADSVDHPAAHLSDEALIQVFDGELEAPHAEGAEAHLAACERCRRRKAELEETAQAFAHAYQARLTPARPDATEARGKLEARLARTTPQPAWAYAAAAVVIAAAGLLMLRAPGEPADTRPPVAADGSLPLPHLTPGAVRTVTIDELCAERLPSGRDVPPDVQQDVLRAYNMGHLPARTYELDHLITPALGGTSDRRNLWPEPYASSEWNAYVKDELEDLLPQLVCERKVPLETAQREIASNWIAAYKKYFRTDRPLRSTKS